VSALLSDHRVVVCTGSGGVGKTTIAAALGILAARQGLRVLVLTVDPARRLATSLGIAHSHTATRVPGQSFAGELYAEMIEPQTIFESFIRGAASDCAEAQRILDNTLYRQLSTTLSGSQEFTSLVRLHDAHESGDYDLVILDTPPTEHAADFLDAPQRISALFDAPIVSWFRDSAGHGGLLKSLFIGGAMTWLTTLRLLTGAQFIRELTDFFAGVGPLAGDISDKSRRAGALLKDSSTAFVLATSLDRAKLQEGSAYYRELERGGYALRSIVVNRAYPTWFLHSSTSVASDLKATLSEPLATLYQRMHRYFGERLRLREQLVLDNSEKVTMAELPELPGDVQGLLALEAMANHLEQALPA